MQKHEIIQNWFFCIFSVFSIVKNCVFTKIALQNWCSCKIFMDYAVKTHNLKFRTVFGANFVRRKRPPCNARWARPWPPSLLPARPSAASVSQSATNLKFLERCYFTISEVTMMKVVVRDLDLEAAGKRGRDLEVEYSDWTWQVTNSSLHCGHTWILADVQWLPLWHPGGG